MEFTLKTIKKQFRKRLLGQNYLGDKYSCPVCGECLSFFNRLPDYYFEQLYNYQYLHSIFNAETLNIIHYSCPECGASDRDRLCALYFDRIFRDIDRNRRYKLIHFAPAQALDNLLRSNSFLECRSADLLMNDADDPVDISDMKVYGDNSVDYFLCSHVLEHVTNDRKAIRELYRILKTGGSGVVISPINLGLNTVYENPLLIDPADRWKHFGQNDHVRIYSKQGFLDRLQEGGFSIKQLGSDYFGMDVLEKNGIHTRSVLYVVSKL